MVDAQAVGDALVQQAQQGGVGGGEDLVVLDADRDEFGDGEEAPVVQLGAGLPPPGEPVPLGVDQRAQRQLLGAGAQGKAWSW